MVIANTNDNVNFTAPFCYNQTLIGVCLLKGTRI